MCTLVKGGRIVKSKSIWMLTLWVAGLGAGAATLGCHQESSQGTEVSAAEKAAAQKAATDKAVADKAAADKAAAAKAASHDKAEAAALPPDLVEMKAEITRMTAQMDLTMAKLDALCAAGKDDLDKQSENTLAAIDALEAEAKLLKERGDSMRDR